MSFPLSTSLILFSHAVLLPILHVEKDMRHAMQCILLLTAILSKVGHTHTTGSQSLVQGVKKCGKNEMKSTECENGAVQNAYFPFYKIFPLFYVAIPTRSYSIDISFQTAAYMKILTYT